MDCLCFGHGNNTIGKTWLDFFVGGKNVRVRERTVEQLMFLGEEEMIIASG